MSTGSSCSKDAAFPCPEIRDRDGDVIQHGQIGISTRLYVATQLLSAMVVHNNTADITRAVKLADALISADNETPEGQR